MNAKTETWKAVRYDVWGNSRDGFEVNDQSTIGTADIVVKSEDGPTYRQLARAFNVRGGAEDNGADFGPGVVEVINKRNGKPMGRFERVSE